MQCWNCQATLAADALSCPSCKVVQPVQPQATLFSALGLAPAVEVSGQELERSYRERSLQVHPDRFTAAPARERRAALEQSTILNEAYRTLKDRTARAFYLLKLHGLDLSREDAGTQKDMPLDFLEEVMELREKLDAHRAASALEAAQGMAEDVARRRSSALAEAEAALGRLLHNPAEGSARDQAAHALARVRYFTRFLEEVSAMEEEALEG